jgi:uncharacterized membrane protein
MREIYGTFVERWYVTLLGAVFAWCAVRHLGWRRTLAYALPAIALGALFENGSVHLGVPYTRYAFDPSLRGKELFVGDVPLMVPLSYTFMGYFAFAAGRLVASGPCRSAARPGSCSPRFCWSDFSPGLRAAMRTCRSRGPGVIRMPSRC